MRLKFIKLIPKEGFAVVCAESKPLFAAEAADCKVYTYGFSDDCDFIAKTYSTRKTKLVSRCITMTDSY